MARTQRIPSRIEKKKYLGVHPCERAAHRLGLVAGGQAQVWMLWRDMTRPGSMPGLGKARRLGWSPLRWCGWSALPGPCGSLGGC